MLSLVITQLCLGFTAFLTGGLGADAVQPELPMVISTVAHVAVGALLLATAVILAIQVWRHAPVAFEEGSRLPPGLRKVMIRCTQMADECLRARQALRQSSDHDRMA